MRSRTPMRTPRRAAPMRAPAGWWPRCTSAIRAAIRPGSPPPSSTGSAARCSSAAAPGRTSSATTAFPAVICASPNDVIVHGIPGAVRARGGRHHLDRLRGHRRRLARRRRLHRRRSATVSPRPLAPDRGHRARRWRPGIAAMVDRRPARPTSATPCRRWPRRPGSRWCGSTSATASAPAMHEAPDVPNYGPAGQGPALRAGNVLAVEPMVNAGARRDRAPRRRLDRGHRRRAPVGPRRAHDRRHRRRPRDPHPCRDAPATVTAQPLDSGRHPPARPSWHLPAPRPSLAARPWALRGRTSPVLRRRAHRATAGVHHSAEAQGRRDRPRRDGRRAPPERHVPGRARERPQGAGPHLREDADALHPDPARGPRPGGAHPLRPHPRSDHLPLQVNESRR